MTDITFPDQSATSTEVPGLLVPGAPDGRVVRRCQRECEALECPKRVSAHKTWQGYWIDRISSYKLEDYLHSCHNQIAEKIRQLQALIYISSLVGTGIPNFNSDYSVAGYPPATDFSFRVQSVGGYMVVCKVNLTTEADMDPRRLDRHGYKAALCDMGLGWLGNTKIPGFGGLVIYAMDISEPSGGEITITFHSMTPIPSRYATKSDPAAPQYFSFRCWWGLGRPIIPEARDTTPMWARKVVFTLDNPTASIITVKENARCVPLGWPWMKTEVLRNGTWEGIGNGCYNAPSGSGWYNVAVDIRGLVMDGVTQLCVTYWEETAPTIADPEVVTRTVDPATAEVHILEAGAQADLVSVIYEAEIDDAGYRWVEWTDAPPIANVESGDWFDVAWDLTGADLNIHMPDPDPEDSEPGPSFAIVAVRATFTKIPRNTDNSLHSPCGDRCINSRPDYSQSVGIAQGNAKWHCLWWPDLDETEKAHYISVGPRCSNPFCHRYAHDDGKRGTWGCVEANFFSVPFKQTYQANTTSFTFERAGAESLLTLSSPFLSATGQNYDKVVWEQGTGYGAQGWGKTVFTPYTAYTDTVHHSEPDPENPEGPPIEWDEEVPVTLSLVSTVGGFEHAVVNGEVVQGLASKIPVTRGAVARHRHSGDLNGSAGRTIVWRDAELCFPDLSETDTDWQIRADGRVLVGWFDAARDKVEEGTEGATYGMLVRTAEGRMRPLKDINALLQDEVVKSGVRVHSVAATDGTLLTLNLRHNATSFSRVYGTGNEATTESVRTGGTSVLLPEFQRPTNFECPESLYGAQAWGYIRPGQCCLRVADAAAPFHLAGKRFQVTAAQACAGPTDPDWEAQLSKFDGVADMGDLDVLAQMDQVAASDEGGLLAEAIALGLEFEAVEGPVQIGAGTWKGSAPDAESDVVLESVESWPSSGEHFFLGFHRCLVGSVRIWEKMSVPSGTGDLDPQYATLKRIWGS